MDDAQRIFKRHPYVIVQEVQKGKMEGMRTISPLKHLVHTLNGYVGMPFKNPLGVIHSVHSPPHPVRACDTGQMPHAFPAHDMYSLITTKIVQSKITGRTFMVSSPTSTRFSPGRAVLVLGGLTALTLYAVTLILCIITQFLLHWADFFSNGGIANLSVGPVAVALLNMLLWWLIVALPKRSGAEARALLAGILCGGVAPAVIFLSGLFFGWWVNGYFLNYQGMHSTNWEEIHWQLTVGPIVYTIFFIWLTIPICVILNRWMARQTQMTR